MVYLNHLDTPYPRDSRASVQHYAGFVNVYSRGGIRRYMWRQQQHVRGTGSRFLRAVSMRGIGWRTVRVWWDGDRALERAIKRSHNLSRYCPVCNGRRSRLRADYWRWEPVSASLLTETSA